MRDSKLDGGKSSFICRSPILTRYAGISGDKTIGDKLMYTPIIINKITPYVDCNYWLKSLETASLFILLL